MSNSQNTSRVAVVFGILALIVAAAAQATTYYVDSGRPDDTGNGLSWGAAKKTIQSGIGAASAGDDVWVKQGAYAESIALKTGVAVYGGFAGWELALTERDYVANLTTIDVSTLAVRYHVVRMLAVNNARIDGFTLTGGNANAAGIPDNAGGGIICQNSNIRNTIANCIIEGNRSGTVGGGIACYQGASPAILNCTIRGNTAVTYGGGISCVLNSPAAITGCVISGNTAQSAGGVGCANANAVLTNCVISGNVANAPAGRGGGISCESGSTPALTNCIISGNFSAGDGGGAACDSSAAALTNCTVASNSAAANGGGLYCNNCSPVLRNTIFAQNGQVAVYENNLLSDPVVLNCLFSDNVDGDYLDEGLIPLTGAFAINLLLGNSGNVDGATRFIMDGPEGITGAWTAAPVFSGAWTTLTCAPRFLPDALAGRLINADTAQSQQALIVGNTALQIVVVGDLTGYVQTGEAFTIVDYHLEKGSGAIDNGTNTQAPSYDIENEPRPVDVPGAGSGTYDIGAYEVQMIYYVDSDRPDDSGDGISWITAKRTIQAAIGANLTAHQVWVRKGTYRETITMRSGVALYAGFGGTETELEQRDVEAHPAFIDASAVIPRHHVVTMNGTVNARIDGFAITGGFASTHLPDPDSRGGGIYCVNVDATNAIVDCRILSNRANATDGSGGGIYCEASSPLIEGCVFSDNRCWYGGAIFCSANSSPQISKCTLSGNSAGYGGALRCDTGAAPTLTNCIVSGNSAFQIGGGLSCLGASPTVVNCTFSSNTASIAGGGVGCDNGASPVLKNTIFENHSGYAVAELTVNSDPVVTNCLFWRNFGISNIPNDYLDEGSTALLGALNINSLPGNSGSVDTDPQFVMSGPGAILGGWAANPLYDSAGRRTTLRAAPGAFVADALVGRIINPDTLQRFQAFILSNTDSEVVVAGDVTSFVAVNDRYVIVDYHLVHGSGAIDRATSDGAPPDDLDSNPRPIMTGSVSPTPLPYDIGAYESQAVYYADASMPDDLGDGLSWATAKRTIQAAIDTTLAAHQVWVRQGTYIETITVRTGMQVYGGFIGNETARDQRNPAVYVTTIDPNIVAIPNHVVTLNKVSGARLDGFTVTGSNLIGDGGGVYCDGAGASNVIANCRIVNNRVGQNGGGLYCVNGAAPQITDCTIAGNVATTGLGGGMALVDSSPTITRCTIAGNSAGGGDGGGVSCSNSSASFKECTISGNEALGNGGGLMIDASSPYLVNTIISGNVTETGSGGGVHCGAGSGPSLVNCTVDGNGAAGQGGGLYCVLNSSPTLLNTLFNNNARFAVAEGDFTSDPVVANCLFRDNFADDSTIAGDYLDEGLTALVGAADINALPGNTGNVDGDPLLVMNGASGVRGSWMALPLYDLANNLTVLTDAAASFAPDALKGRLINPDILQRRQALIVTNTVTQIIVVGDLTGIVQVDDRYLLADYQVEYSSAAIDRGAAGPGAPSIDIEDKTRPIDLPFLGVDGTGTEFDIGVYETQGPLIQSIVRLDPNPTSAPSVNFLVAFTVPVTGVDLPDFVLTTSGVIGAAITGVTADVGAARTVTVNTGFGNGTIRLDVVDDDSIVDASGNVLGGPGIGNGNFSTGQFYTIDKTGPVADDIACTTPNPTNGDTIKFSVHFDKAVKNFNDASDLVIVGTGSLAYGSVTIANGPQTYTVGLVDVTGDGDVTLAVSTTSDVQDLAGNALIGSVTSLPVYVDHTLPTAALGTAPNVGAAQAGMTTYQFTVVYQDTLAIRIGTLDSLDVRVAGPGGLDQLATLISVAPPGDGSPKNAVYQITPPGGDWDAADSGTYSIAVDPNQVFDTAGNAVVAVTLGDFTVDLVPPTAVLSSAPNVGSTQQGQTIYQFKVRYDDNVAIDVAALTDGDVRVTGPGGFDLLAQFVSVDLPGNGSPRTATYQIVPPGGSWDVADTGSYLISLEPSQVFDTFGNVAAPIDLGSFFADVNQPIATLTFAPDVDSTGAGQTVYTFSVTYEDATAVDVATLDTGDIFVTGGSGFSQIATFVDVQPPGNGTPRLATYQITPPNGAWDATGTGAYTIMLLGNQVSNTSGNPAASGALGVFRVDVILPMAALTNAPNVNSASNPTQYDFEVTYTDNWAVLAGSFDNADVRVIGPNGFEQLAAFLFVNPPGDGTPRAATYRLTPPDGAWDSMDDGLYTLILELTQVTDLVGNPVNLLGPLGGFTVDTTPPAATMTLINNSPTGADTIAWALAFSEPVAPTFSVSDVANTGTLTGTATTATLGGDPAYLVTIALNNPNADGTIGFLVGADVFDLAGNRYLGGEAPICSICNWTGIAAQPGSAQLYSGDAHTLAVAPRKDCCGDALLYQWWRDDGSPHAGPTTPSWLLDPAAATDRGFYWCELTYDGTTYSSTTATIQVEDRLQITADPVGGAAQIGGSHTFCVTTTGGYPPLEYEWLKDNVPLFSSTSPCFTLDPLQASDLGGYHVVVFDDFTDVVESNTGYLTVGVDVPATRTLGLVFLAAALIAAALLACWVEFRSKA